MNRPNDKSPIEPLEDRYSKVRIPVHNAEGNAQAEATATAEEEPNWKDLYLRLYADLENSKRRLARNYEVRLEQEKERLLRDILPLADNLERALAHASGQEGKSGLRQGVEITLKAFTDMMARHGVRPIQAKGEPFDPELHEAIGFVSDPDLPPGTVASVEETGYTFGDRLLRPARVFVTAG